MFGFFFGKMIKISIEIYLLSLYEGKKKGFNNRSIIHKAFQMDVKMSQGARVHYSPESFCFQALLVTVVTIANILE